MIVRLLALLAALCLTASAQAHNTQLSSAKLDLSGHLGSVTMELNARDVEVALEVKLLTADGVVDPAALAEARPKIEAYLGARLELGTAAARCSLRMDSVLPAGDHVRAAGLFTCPAFKGSLVYRSTLFTDIDARARHMITVTGDSRRFGLLSISTPSIEILTISESPWAVFGRYLVAGVEHIAIGFDHIAFLVATIVWGRRFLPLLKVITAFTLAHSITLSLAVLGVVAPPSAWVEGAIAASIVYVAVENFFVRDVGRRWPLTFVFGLMHGFGFASVLREYGLPREALVPALAAFNIGVEMGQLFIVAAALLLLHGVDRLERRAGVTEIPDRRVAWSISVVVGVLGVWWLAQRIPAMALAP
ncbi:MAG: HupE/UreJ family protein [Betaproteobacteria bacterium]